MIAGQGTIGLELAEQVPEDATVVVPIGGGGLAAGIALALRAVAPERAHRRRPGAASGGYTIADGIAVKQPGRADDVDPRRRCSTTSSTSPTRRSPRRSCSCSSATKLVVEGAGAVAVAALLAGRVGGGDGPVCAILSGGNIDPTLADRGHAPRALARAAATSSSARASPTGRASC